MKPYKMFRTADMVLYVFWGLCALGLFVFSSKSTEDNISGTRLTVICGNETFGVYDLDRDQVIEIDAGNICEIKDRAVRMIYADCPDQICVHSKEISGIGESIVCLPNHVILKISGEGEDPGVDAISE